VIEVLRTPVSEGARGRGHWSVEILRLSGRAARLAAPVTLIAVADLRL
jgi:hypothetical protein